MKNKLLLIGITFTLLLFIFPIKALAADLTVICTGSSCSTGESGLFNETNIAPGFSVTKSILIDNTANFDNCNLQLMVTRQGEKGFPDLAERIITLIKSDDDSVYFGESNTKSFNDLFGQTISLGVVNKNSTSSYSWLSNFETSSGNEYQGKLVSFGFDLNFICGTLSAPTLTPTSTPILTPTSIPTSRPSQNQNQVQNLGGNGIGDVGAEVTLSPTPSILGDTDNQIVSTFNTNQGDQIGSILGLECENPITYWWVILLIQAILSFVVLILRSSKMPLVGSILVMVLFGLISQLLHNLWGCNCLEDGWCGRYFYLNLGIILVSTLGSFIARSKNPKQ